METIQEALEFENNVKSFRSRDEKIWASLKAKELILSLNEFYKKSKDEKIMDIMKRLTVIKRKYEARLKPKIRV
ncbi:hypothetical protein [Flavicella marina]|uniref:hypothetical protein n=1 Tax=Flavicella marina TaxID=1475951 RepID=UPI0012642437|nr:hypothetical protein [Flavicella marina]